MSPDARHARLRDELHADPERCERYVATVAERLRKSRADAYDWIFDMYEENRADLVDVVVEGILIEAGQMYHPEEPPRSVEGRTNG